MMAQIARAAWLAMATVATRTGLRASSAVIRGSAVSGRCRLRRTSEVMPMTRSLRRYWSPILEIRPRRSLPPLEFCKGVSPSHAANCRPDWNWVGSVTVAARAVAPSRPTPGTVAMRRASSLERYQAKRSRSS